MPSPLRTELTLAADPRLLRLVEDYLRGLADLGALPLDQAELLTLAVKESCRNIMQYGFDDDDSGSLTLAGELTPKALTLSIRDQGRPFDETLEADYLKSQSANPDLASRVRGLLLIHQGADEVCWISHGPEGNECRLTKYLSGVCRLETPPVASSFSHEATPPGVAQDYTIRLLQPADAIRVARLMYCVYGYTYPNEDFYYPDRLAHDLETGRHVGVVAVADNGEIVGHVGIERSDLGPLAELGQLAVAPAHRGQGLKKRMGDRLQDEIRRLGLVGLFGRAVTVHTISQEASEARGLHLSAIQLLEVQVGFKKPQTFEFGSGHGNGDLKTGLRRETLVLYFKYLAPPETKAICAPSRHREMLAKIYANLEAPVEFLESRGPTGVPGRLAVHYDRDTGTGTIRVNRIGIDTLPEIYQARRDLCDLAGAAVVGLDLPLAQGGTPYLCDAAEADGFFFAGVRPHFAPDGDFLRLQYLNTELDPGRIHLASPFARELLTYILEERERVGKHPG